MPEMCGRVTDLQTTLAVGHKLERRAGQRQRRLIAGHGGQALALSNLLRQLGAVFFDQRRLGIVQVELRWAAALEQVNHPLCLGREVRGTKRAPAGRRAEQRVRLEQAAQRDAAQPHPE